MLAIGDAELFGGLLHNPGQWSIVGMAYERAQMMRDVMVEAARKPTYDRIARCIISRRREDVIDAVVELAAVRGEVRCVDSMRRLEYQRYGQTDDQVNQHECPSNQQRRSPQHHNRQNQHVRQVERLPREEDEVLPQRMPVAFQIVVGREEKALKVPDENIVQREHRVKEQRIDVLEPMQGRARFMRRKSKDAPPRKRVVFAVDVDAGVVASVMEDAPHVRVDSANIEDIVQDLVYRWHRRDGVVVAVMGNVQQEECLGETAQNVERNELP